MESSEVSLHEGNEDDYERDTFPLVMNPEGKASRMRSKWSLYLTLQGTGCLMGGGATGPHGGHGGNAVRGGGGHPTCTKGASHKKYHMP